MTHNSPDVDEGGDGDDGCDGGTAEEWNSSTDYPTACTTVTYEGKEYQNQWYANAGDAPSEELADESMASDWSIGAVWLYPEDDLNICN